MNKFFIPLHWKIPKTGFDFRFRESDSNILANNVITDVITFRLSCTGILCHMEMLASTKCLFIQDWNVSVGMYWLWLNLHCGRSEQDCSKGMNDLDTGYETETGFDDFSGTHKYHRAFFESLEEKTVMHCKPLQKQQCFSLALCVCVLLWTTEAVTADCVFMKIPCPVWNRCEWVGLNHCSRQDLVKGPASQEAGKNRWEAERQEYSPGSILNQSFGFGKLVGNQSQRDGAWWKPFQALTAVSKHL